MPMKYMRQGVCSINSKGFNDNGINGNNDDDNGNNICSFGWRGDERSSIKLLSLRKQEEQP